MRLRHLSVEAWDKLTSRCAHGALTTVGFITAVPAVRNTVALCVLLQDAGATVALIPDGRAGRFCNNKNREHIAIIIN